MSLLHWLPGQPEDRDALRTFQCTPKPTRSRAPFGPKGLQHPAPHEQRVQAMIRQTLKPARVPGQTTLLGWTRGHTLGGVVSYRVIGTEQSFQIDIIAVELQYRRRGGLWAREALETALDFIAADADGNGYHAPRVAASIHQDNGPSQRLFDQAGFEHASVQPDGYETWSTTLDIAGGLFS